MSAVNRLAATPWICPPRTRAPVQLNGLILTRRTARITDMGSLAAILLYHRIASDPIDAHGLCVSPEHFRSHLDVIRELAEPAPLADVLCGSTVPRKLVVSVTVDDGYADMSTAARMLADADIPGTFFVPTGALGQVHGYWFDNLERMFFANPRLPPSIDWESTVWPLRTAEDVIQAHDSLHRLLRSRPTMIKQSLVTLESKLGHDGKGHPGRAITTEDNLISSLSRHTQLSIGLHGKTHAMLSRLMSNEEMAELRDSMRFVRQTFGHRPAILAYPFGTPDSYSHRTVATCRHLGITSGLTTDQSVYHYTEDPYRIPRLLVRDWSAEEFRAWFVEGFDSRWLTKWGTDRRLKLANVLHDVQQRYLGGAR